MNNGNRKYSVCILGSGISGLSAAVFAANDGFNVTLIESKPRFGGRAYSFTDQNANEVIDNGQHILASWYKNTLEYFSLIGSSDKLNVQKNLHVKFADLNGNSYEFKCPSLFPPFHLIGGIFRYKALTFKDKISLLRLIFSLMLKNDDDELQNKTVSELFDNTKQTENIIIKFWKPFIVAVFNSTPEKTSAYLFKKIIEIGFINKDGANLILPVVNLNELYIEPSVDYLNKRNCLLFKDLKINKIVINNERIDHIITDEGIDRYFDFYVSTLPFFEFGLLEPYLDIDTSLIKPSPIINIHIIFKENIDFIFKDNFVGILDANIQWIFKVNSKQICIVISSADEFIDNDKHMIYEMVYTELTGFEPEFINLTVSYYRVIKEVRATFVPDNITNRSRPPHKTSIQNLFLAGDWTDTDLPCTIESAVLSSKKCINHILESFN